MPHPDEDFKFGLMDRDVRDYQSLFGLYVLPLKKMWQLVVRRVRPRAAIADQPPEGSQP